MPPVMTFGVTVLSVMRQSLTDGSSPILLQRARVTRLRPASWLLEDAVVADGLLMAAVVERAERRRVGRRAAPRSAAGRSRRARDRRRTTRRRDDRCRAAAVPLAAYDDRPPVPVDVAEADASGKVGGAVSVVTLPRRVDRAEEEQPIPHDADRRPRCPTSLAVVPAVFTDPLVAWNCVQLALQTCRAARRRTPIREAGSMPLLVTTLTTPPVAWPNSAS